MATGRFNISTGSSYVDGYVEWVSTANNTNNTSNITLTAYLKKSSASSSASSINNRSITRYFYVDGIAYGGAENASITLPNNNSYVQVYQKTVTGIKHNDNGSKSVAIGFEMIYTSVTAFNVPRTNSTAVLDIIPRYATANQSLKSKTETSITMNWSSDSTIDYVWYSINNGTSWVAVGSVNATSGSYTISGLSANTTYSVKTRVRRKDSQLTTDSSVLSIPTYDIPYATSCPNFIVGNTLTIPIYNPLGRKVKVYLVPNGGTDLGGDVITGTSISGYVSDTFKNGLYQASPSSAINTYKVKTICDEIKSTWTTSGSGTYTIPNTPPEFSSFEYLDSDSNIVAITGSNQFIVKNKSNLRVKIATTNKMLAKNYATPNRYEISCANRTQSLSYSEEDTYIDLGTINSSGLMNIVVKAYDSRGFFTQKTLPITVIDYIEPIQENTLARINNFENETELKIKGTFALVECNGVAKNTIQKVRFRYKRNESGTEYGSYIEIVPTINGNKYECELRTLDLDNRNGFVFEVGITDIFGIEILKEISVDEGIPIMFINKNKRNVGIGCINEHGEGTLETASDIINHGDYIMKNGLPVLSYKVVGKIKVEE